MTKKSSGAAEAGPGRAIGNILVFAAMGVVTFGLAIGFYAQLGMPFWAALSGALLLLAIMMASHVSLLRGQRIAELEKELARLKSGQPISADAEGSRSVPVPVAVGKPKKSAARAGAVAAANEGAAPGQAFDPAAQPSPPPGTLSLADEIALARSMAEPHGQPTPQVASPVQGNVPVGRQLDTATIQELVKKLADETSGARAGNGETMDAASVDAPAPNAPTTPVAMPDRPAQDNAITDSVRALRATADAMRPTAPAAAPATTGKPASAAPAPKAPLPAAATAQNQSMKAVAPPASKPPVPTAAEHSPASPAPAVPLASKPIAPPPPPTEEEIEQRVGLLADALSADRIDVLLEPILGLKDQATRHYEISIRLRSESGETMNPADDQHMLSGTGILPLIDIAKISRFAEVARRLAERGKTGAMFAGLAGESLGDDDFLTRFAEIYNEREAITEQLVIALSQAEVRVFADAHWDMIKDLGSCGFRLALDHVTDLDMDFDQLREAGVQFVKLDASVFLEGLAAADGVQVPASDIVKFLGDKNLTLVVGEIDTDNQLSRLVNCGVEFGNGRLFGGPRVVKAQVFAAKAAAAA